MQIQDKRTLDQILQQLLRHFSLPNVADATLQYRNMLYMTQVMGGTDFQTPPAGGEKNGLHTVFAVVIFLVVVLVIASQLANSINPPH